MPCYSPLKGWKNEETGGIEFRAEGRRETMEVACGQCLGCRLDRSRMWAMRIVHEASLHDAAEGNSFVTLTYRDRIECTTKQLAKGQHVPVDWSLHLDHVQKFLKRLRKRFPQKIRFFLCGEYGATCRHGGALELRQCEVCTVGRPHYHLILFNCAFPDLEVYSQQRGEPRFTSAILESLWGYGFVDVGEVTFESAAYVARYCLKKVTGVAADDHYRSLDEDGELHFLKPEFCTMSRRPGIGREWYRLYKGDMFPADDVPVPGSGVFKKVPRYYATLFENEEPLEFEEIKRLRQVFRKEHEEEYSPARLMAKYQVKKAQIALLKRSV